MKSRLFFICTLFEINYAVITNNFIVDYFNHEEVTDVVGFTCNTQEVDVLLVRLFSKLHKRATIHKLNDVSNLSVIASVSYWKLGVFCDARCYDNETLSDFLKEAADLEMYRDLHHWLIVGNDLLEILNIIDDGKFIFTTNFMIAITHDTNNFALYDVFNILKERGGILDITSYGEWNLEDGLDSSFEPSKFVRRANLHGLVLKAQFFKFIYKSANDTLENYMDDYQHPTRDGRQKFGYNIIRHLSEMYNFSVEYSESSIWEPGDILGPIARNLANNLIDISGSPLSLTVLRTYVLKYVHQDFPFRTCFVFRNPQLREVKVQEILRPLANITWYLMGITMIAGVVFLTAALHYDDIKIHPFRISDSILIVLGSACQQSTDMKIKRISTRMMFLCLMIFSLLMYNYYSASVVSARLDEPIFKINDSLTQMVKLKLKLASESMVYLDFFLKFNDWETKQFHKVWLKVPESEKFMDPENAMKLVQNSRFAYHMHPEVGYETIERTYSNREICELMEVHLARPQCLAISATYNSSIVELLRVGLTKIQEVGIRNRQLDRCQWRKPRCRTDILTASSITIDEFSPHLLLLLMGIILALFVYLLEIIFDRYNYYQRSKVKK